MESSNPNNSQITTVPSAPLALSHSLATGISVTPVAGSYTTAYGTTQTPTQMKTERQEWSTGLFGCFSDIPNSCMTCWCPCVTFGQIAEIVDRGATSCGTSAIIYLGICHFLCCVWVYTFFYRTKMRNQYNLPESPCPDCIAHCLCHKHALCQEYRELKNRGFDMSIGWPANMERMNRGVMMAPIVPGGMAR